MTLLDGYPHDLPDEEVIKIMKKLAEGLSPNINDVMRVTPLIELGQAELHIQASNRLKDATSKVFWLTVALVVLTACLVGATIALIVVSGKAH
jgi:hypothetical protein